VWNVDIARTSLCVCETTSSQRFRQRRSRTARERKAFVDILESRKGFTKGTTYVDLREIAHFVSSIIHDC
jgi:ERCC4-related helicase